MQVPVCLEEKDFHVILKGNLFQGPWTEGSRLALPKWRQSLAIIIAHLCVKDMILQSKLQNGECATLAVKKIFDHPSQGKSVFGVFSEWKSCSKDPDLKDPQLQNGDEL